MSEENGKQQQQEVKEAPKQGQQLDDEARYRAAFDADPEAPKSQPVKENAKAAEPEKKQGEPEAKPDAQPEAQPQPPEPEPQGEDTADKEKDEKRVKDAQRLAHQRAMRAAELERKNKELEAELLELKTQRKPQPPPPPNVAYNLDQLPVVTEEDVELDPEDQRVVENFGWDKDVVKLIDRRAKKLAEARVKPFEQSMAYVQQRAIQEYQRAELDNYVNAVVNDIHDPITNEVIPGIKDFVAIATSPEFAEWTNQVRAETGNLHFGNTDDPIKTRQIINQYKRFKAEKEVEPARQKQAKKSEQVLKAASMVAASTVMNAPKPGAASLTEDERYKQEFDKPPES